MWTPPCRLPPSENGEWWEIGDESRGGIPYYYHTKTGETVWEKPDGFVIPLTVLQVRFLVYSIYPDFRSPSTRIPRWVAVSQSHFLQTQPRVRPHVQQHKSNVPRPNVHVHTLRKPEVPYRLLGYNRLQVVPLPRRRRAQLLPLCGATLLPILTIQRRRAWRRRFRPFLAPRRAPRQHPPPLTVPSSLLVNPRSRWLLLLNV